MGPAFELARLVRAAGARGERVERILEVARRELAVSLEFVNVDSWARDDVAARVLVSVWRTWIPEAKRRLASGDWKDHELITKLRTSLCRYAKSRARDCARDEGVFARKLKECADVRPTGPGSNGHIHYTRDEARFLGRVLTDGDLIANGPVRLTAAMRLVVLARRWTKGLKRDKNKATGQQRTWRNLFEAFTRELQEVG